MAQNSPVAALDKRSAGGYVSVNYEKTISTFQEAAEAAARIFEPQLEQKRPGDFTKPAAGWAQAPDPSVIVFGHGIRCAKVAFWAGRANQRRTGLQSRAAGRGKNGERLFDCKLASARERKEFPAWNYHVEQDWQRGGAEPGAAIVARGISIASK
jgi:hypothetical protein